MTRDQIEEVMRLVELYASHTADYSDDFLTDGNPAKLDAARAALRNYLETLPPSHNDAVLASICRRLFSDVSAYFNLSEDGGVVALDAYIRDVASEEIAILRSIVDAAMKREREKDELEMVAYLMQKEAN